MLKSGAEGNDWETLSDGYGNVSENKRGGDRFQLFRNRLQGLNVLGGDTSEGNGASLGGQGCGERSQDWVLEDVCQPDEVHLAPWAHACNRILHAHVCVRAHSVSHWLTCSLTPSVPAGPLSLSCVCARALSNSGRRAQRLAH